MTRAFLAVDQDGRLAPVHIRFKEVSRAPSLAESAGLGHPIPWSPLDLLKRVNSVNSVLQGFARFKCGDISSLNLNGFTRLGISTRTRFSLAN